MTGILIFYAGMVVGALLGIVLFALLDMAGDEASWEGNGETDGQKPINPTDS